MGSSGARMGETRPGLNPQLEEPSLPATDASCPAHEDCFTTLLAWGFTTDTRWALSPCRVHTQGANPCSWPCSQSPAPPIPHISAVGNAKSRFLSPQHLICQQILLAQPSSFYLQHQRQDTPCVTLTPKMYHWVSNVRNRKTNLKTFCKTKWKTNINMWSWTGSHTGDKVATKDVGT